MINIFKNKANEKTYGDNFLSKVASLLIHAAKIDEVYTAEEKEIIKQTLIKLGAKASSIENIIAEAIINEKNSNQILDFTREIKKRSDSDKIEVIEHCFKLDNFKNVTEEEISVLKKKHGIPENKIIVGTISRYVKLKGIDYVIQAFKEVQKTSPKIHLLLSNSGGNYEDIIRSKLNELPQDSYTEIKFEPNLYALYSVLDIFCHVPINSKVEAYGQTYVEALAAGVPSIYTLSGIANDFIKHENNALVVDYKSSRQIADAIQRLLSDNELRNKLIKNGQESVQRFDLPIMIEKLERLYLSQ